MLLTPPKQILLPPIRVAYIVFYNFVTNKENKVFMNVSIFFEM